LTEGLFRLTYGGRTEGSMAFGIGSACSVTVSFLAEDRDGRPDLDDVVKQLPDGGLIYVCGPLALLRAVQSAAEAAHGPDQDLVRFELFSRTGVEPKESVPLDGDSYELVLARTGHTLRMKPERQHPRDRPGVGDRRRERLP
jgi:ferredoxin-NADP reductase